MKKIFFCILLFIMVPFLGWTQCMQFPLTLNDRVQQSSLVVEATVVSQTGFWNISQDFIYTSTILQVNQVFKGTLSAPQIEIISEGGTIGNTKIITEPSLSLSNGVTGIFLLSGITNSNIPSARITALTFEPFALNQSFIEYDASAQSASGVFETYPVLTQLHSAIQNITGINGYRVGNSTTPLSGGASFLMVPPTISAIAPGTTTAGTFSTITITGTNFGASYVTGTSNVQFPDANNGGAGYISAPANHIVSWNSTQIQVWVPTQGGSGNIRVTNNLGETTTSGIAITVNYNESNVNSGGVYYQPDLINNNGTGGYTFKYNTTFNGNAPAVAAFERALQTWRCGTFVNFNRSGTTALACQALDGNNIVTFDGSCALPAGVLGISYSYYSSCGGGVWYLNENDLKFRTNGTGGINWNFGPAATAGGLFDFESVCLHELGHSHQLGHTITPVTVMNYAIGPNTDRRTLTPVSETAGGNDIMSRSVITNSCGPTAMQALTAGTCAINAPIADFSGTPLTGCNSLVVTFTDASLNTPTSWTWSFPGGVPNTFVGQNPPAITYGTPGNYTVTLTVSNAFGSDVETKTNYVVVNNCPPPVANFSATPTTLCANGSVQFIDGSTNTPTSWSWTFPGGTPGTSTAQNPVIVYNTPGTYSVTLTATNAYGNNSITKTNYITVNNCPPPPVASFTGTPTTLCAGGTVNFTDASSNTPTGWQWTFNGGTPLSSIAQNPSVVYNTPGTYAVTLTAINSSGSNTITLSGYITVNVCSAPVANFAGYPTTVCAGQSVTYVDQSTNTPTSWSWTFTGGTPGVSAAQNPVINYATAGTYTVSLTSTNAFGSNTFTRTNYINVVTCPAAGSGLIVNDGSFVYLQPGALICVEGGIITQDNLSNIGSWDNRGDIRVQGDWTNNSTGSAFINSSPGNTELYGANQVIAGSNSTNFYTLRLTGSGIKTQNVDAYVEGILELNDRELATQANKMHVTNTSTAAITRTGGLNSTPVQGFVSSTGNGRLVRYMNTASSYLFPVGSSIPPARFRPVSIRPQTVGANVYEVRMVNNDATANGYNRATRDPALGVINAGWYQKINHPVGSSLTEFSLYADDVQDAIASWPLLKLTQWGHNAPPVWWEDIGGAGSAAASPALGSILRTNWSNFSSTENFNIAPQSNPLPIDLLSFSGKCEHTMVSLEWETASETNNDYFLLESSINGDRYDEVKRFKGNGTTTIISNYRTDIAQASEKMFYRLTQYDFDGRSTSFTPIAVSCRNETTVAPLINLYPNPAKDILTTDFNLSSSARIQMVVVNMLGQTVMEKELTFDSGLHKQSIDVSVFAEDVYQVIFTSESFKIIRRFALVR